MQEINYQVFDKESGLPIPVCSDKIVRDLAKRSEKSLSDMFVEVKKELRESGIKYMIPGDKREIIPMPKNAFSACNPTYYDNYQDALKAL